MTHVAKPLINGNLRHNEYYDMQNTFDDLYARAQNGEVFTDLMSIILSEDNIQLAYRNIKGNAGSRTPGTDGLSINDLRKLSTEEIVELIDKDINSRQGYRPKPVKRVEIPKENGKTRPLGIPSIRDRLIQQCIKQVMEPICEAKFHKNSFGFRPGRSVEHAIAETHRLLNQSKCHFIVEVDIKSFFDEVDHRKLRKQIWALGIHDKHLLYVISQMLKAPIRMPDGSQINPQKGTPQGGILSPLLANIVLNELDWWISSQWENHPVIDKFTKRYNKLGRLDNGNRYNGLRRTRLKEMYIVRYADDFRIFCRYRRDAEKVKHAVTQWLKDRLRLETSPEKTRIVNTKRKYAEFLGFKIKVTYKFPEHKSNKKCLKGTSGKWVTRSHICNKRIKTITDQLCEQARKISRAPNIRDSLTAIRRFNAMVLGIQNYFRLATEINSDCQIIAYRVDRVLFNRLRGAKRTGRLTKDPNKGRKLNDFEKERYGKSKMLRFDKATKSPIYPIGYVQSINPLCIRFDQTPYTPQGRITLHKALELDFELLHQMMRSKVYGSVEYADNRLSLFSAQNGKDAITGILFSTTEEIHCHHKTPRRLGGTDKYSNLILLHTDTHKLVHAEKEETIQKYLNKLQLDKKQIAQVNRLRKSVQLPPIKS
ncbi:MAG: group II intron reverse transcriptase/maturase [Anaerolineaceae bacterium]|nr:group II intron reverse transcriptase/maturase [Anaerolineaceae bacterium]